VKKRRSKNPHAVALRRLGGVMRSELKRRANRENGRKGRFWSKATRRLSWPGAMLAARGLDDARKTERLGRDNSQPFWAPRYRSRRRRHSLPSAVEGPNRCAQQPSVMVESQPGH
jgi:hypothetical protein